MGYNLVVTWVFNYLYLVGSIPLDAHLTYHIDTPTSHLHHTYYTYTTHISKHHINIKYKYIYLLIQTASPCAGHCTDHWRKPDLLTSAPPTTLTNRLTNCLTSASENKLIGKMSNWNPLEIKKRLKKSRTP